MSNRTDRSRNQDPTMSDLDADELATKEPASASTGARYRRRGDIEVDLPAVELRPVAPRSQTYRRRKTDILAEDSKPPSASAVAQVQRPETGLKRLFDICVSLVALVLASPIIILVFVAVRLTSPGPAIYRSVRVGPNSSRFEMFKFRTMRTDTPQLATHLLSSPESYLTPVGSFLRKTSVDELPQFLNVLKGDMSIIGPRPALFNQDDLVAMRKAAGVDALRPGVTGLAQTCGRDLLTLEDKVALEKTYSRTRTPRLDARILVDTVVGVFLASGVNH